MKEKTAVLFSGGKDSCLALDYALKYSEVKCLISVISENKASFMFHTPNIELVEKQAEAIELPIIIQRTRGEKEKELEDLERAIQKAVKEFKIEGVVTGAIESIYQSSRIQKVCHKLGLECFNPLWQRDAEEHWKELIGKKFKVIIISVSAEGLGKEWLGKEINKENFEELERASKKYKFHLAFEGGEAETFVVDARFFKKKLEIKKSFIDEEENRLIIEEIGKR